ncbi:hypothetical protein ZWY2020_039608 [Hordeum vulgare]|nr:hypothetical protein ZWY2020_039608 [Hordeum vulgare]
MAAPSGPSGPGGGRQQPSASGAVQGGVGFGKASGPLGPVVFGTGVAQAAGAQPATGAVAFGAAPPQATKPGQKRKKKKKKTGNGQPQVARICPNPSWVWEAVPNGDDSFTLSFPSKEDLLRIDGIVFGIPAQNIRLLFSQWRPEEVEPIMELHQTWVQVSGVPPSMRHFLGLWVVVTLIGSTIDVDLLALRRRGIVRILVGMVADDCFRKTDALGPYIKTTGVLVLKGYAFTFRPEAADFIPEPDFVPFFWERKEKDDPADKGSEGRDETGHKGKQSSTTGNLGATDMAIDTNSGQSSTHVQSASVAHLLNGMAITPINHNPQTPRGKELVRKLKQSGGWNRMVGTHLVPKQLLGRTATQMRTVPTPNSASCMTECGDVTGRAAAFTTSMGHAVLPVISPSSPSSTTTPAIHTSLAVGGAMHGHTMDDSSANTVGICSPRLNTPVARMPMPLAEASAKEAPRVMACVDDGQTPRLETAVTSTLPSPLERPS